VGRFGEWQYFNMDHSMRSGKTAAEEILATRRAGGASALAGSPRARRAE
jgi:hypothetical protein